MTVKKSIRMRASHAFVVATLSLATMFFSTAARSQENAFVQLFDGRTLNGWIVSKGAPTDNFAVRDGAIAIKGPTGWLRTERTYQDFTLRASVRFKTTSELGNSGIFLRSNDDLNFVGRWPGKGYEIEARDMSSDLGLAPPWAGQVLRLGGSEGRPLDGIGTFHAANLLKAFKRNDWNDFEVIAHGTRVWAFVNGVLVSSASQVGNPTGYIGLQAESGEIEWRNLSIREHRSAPGDHDTPKPLQLAGASPEKPATSPSGELLLVKDGAPQVSAKSMADFKLKFEFQPLDDNSAADIVLRSSATADGRAPVDGAAVKLRSLQLKNRLSGPPALVGDPRWPGAIGSQAAPLESANYDSAAAIRANVAAGSWHTAEIEVTGDEITVRVNGELVSKARGIANARGGYITLLPGTGSVSLRQLQVIDYMGE